MASTTVAEQLGQFISAFRSTELSPSQGRLIKTYFLDWLGSAIAGRDEVPVRAMTELVGELGGKTESTVIADDTKTNCLLAALANGAASHVVEMDDLHRESILHPATAVIPAALALAEREQSSGQELIAAIAVGYEVAIRVALAAGPGHYRFWHTTGTCGTFGAASAAAVLLGLTADQTAHALGSAGTQASGLWAFLVENAMSKQLHPGKAGLNGLLAALLAQKGFTGAKRILEDEKGFWPATCDDYDLNKCLAELGTTFHFERNSLKYHASCGHTHAAVDATLQATDGKPLAASAVNRVSVKTYQAAIDLLGNVSPVSPYLAKFNIPFCVASAINVGHAALSAFTTETIADPALLALMERLSVNSDKTLTAQYPAQWPATVEIELTNGTRLNGSVSFPKGDPENPLSEGEIVGKFKDLTRDFISDTRAERLVERVLNLEQATDVSKLLAP